MLSYKSASALFFLFDGSSEGSGLSDLFLAPSTNLKSVSRIVDVPARPSAKRSNYIHHKKS